MPRLCSLAMLLTLVAGCAQDSAVGDKKSDEKRVTPQDKTTRNDVELVVRGVVAERLKVGSSGFAVGEIPGVTA